MSSVDMYQRVVDAVVVAYHGDKWLSKCVSFLLGDSPASIRLVIGDNWGNAGIGDLVDNTTIVAKRLYGPLGFAEANNLVVVEECQEARYICFLNQDTKSPKRWLERASVFMDYNPCIGAVTPLISNYEGDGWDPNFLDCVKDTTLDTTTRGLRSQKTEFVEVPVIPAAAMLVRSDVLCRVGGFDPIYGSYYEDYDLCQRIRRAGYQVGVWTGATVAHFSGSATRSAADEERRQRMIVRNRLIYRIRHSGNGRLRQLVREVVVELPRQILRRLLGRPASKPLMVVLGGYLDAARVARRLLFAKYDERLWRAYLADIGWPTELLRRDS